MKSSRQSPPASIREPTLAEGELDDGVLLKRCPKATFALAVFNRHGGPRPFRLCCDTADIEKSPKYNLEMFPSTSFYDIKCVYCSLFLTKNLFCLHCYITLFSSVSSQSKHWSVLYARNEKCFHIFGIILYLLM